MGKAICFFISPGAEHIAPLLFYSPVFLWFISEPWHYMKLYIFFPGNTHSNSKQSLMTFISAMGKQGGNQTLPLKLYAGITCTMLAPIFFILVTCSLCTKIVVSRQWNKMWVNVGKATIPSIKQENFSDHWWTASRITICVGEQYFAGNTGKDFGAGIKQPIFQFW